MDKPLILVAESGPFVKSPVTEALEAHGYPCLAVPNDVGAIFDAFAGGPDIIILCFGSFGIEEAGTVKEIRCRTDAPVIVISEEDSEEDKIAALDAGADDCLAGSFSEDELEARIRVILRRLGVNHCGVSEASPVFVNGSLRIDYAAGCVYLDGNEIHLTPTEYKLLCLLSRNIDKVVTRSFLTWNIWGRSRDKDIAALRVFMAALREKLESGPHPACFIKTRVGVGYRMLKIK